MKAAFVAHLLCQILLSAESLHVPSREGELTSDSRNLLSAIEREELELELLEAELLSKNDVTRYEKTLAKALGKIREYSCDQGFAFAFAAKLPKTDKDRETAVKIAREITDHAMTSFCTGPIHIGVYFAKEEDDNVHGLFQCYNTCTRDEVQTGIQNAFEGGGSHPIMTTEGALNLFYGGTGQTQPLLVRVNLPNLAVGAHPENFDFKVTESKITKGSTYDDLFDVTKLNFIKPRCEVYDLKSNRPGDLDRLIGGFIKLKHDGLIDALAALHYQTFYNWWGMHGAHMDDGIWPWHRAYISMMERALQLATDDYKLRLSFWNWSEQDIESADIWEDVFGGAQNGDPEKMFCVTNGVFRRDVWSNDSSQCIRRRMNAFSCGKQVKWEQILRDLTLKSYHEFRQTLEGGGHRHNYLHNKFGGDMRENDSPRDPIFFFHHCFHDLIWDLWLQDHHRNFVPQDAQFTLDFKMPQLDSYYPNSKNEFEPLLRDPSWIYPSNLTDPEAMGYVYFTRPGEASRAMANHVGGNAASYTISSVRKEMQEKVTGLGSALEFSHILPACSMGDIFLTQQQTKLCIDLGEIKYIQLVTPQDQYVSQFEGIVQVRDGGIWKYLLCNPDNFYKTFTDGHASHLCAKMGFSRGKARCDVNAGDVDAKEFVKMASSNCTGAACFKETSAEESKNAKLAGVECEPGVKVTPEGKVEVYDSIKEWGTVCGTQKWGFRQMSLACELSGQGPSISDDPWRAALRATDFDDTFIECLRYPNRFDKCSSVNWQGTECDREQRIVKCAKAVRVKGEITAHRIKGRVEIYKASVWGRVCADNGWNSVAAQTVCKELKPDKRVHSHKIGDSAPRSDEGPHVVWMSGLKCSSGSESLLKCEHDGFARNLCREFGDATIDCEYEER